MNLNLSAPVNHLVSDQSAKVVRSQVEWGRQTLMSVGEDDANMVGVESNEGSRKRNLDAGAEQIPTLADEQEDRLQRRCDGWWHVG